MNWKSFDNARDIFGSLFIISMGVIMVALAIAAFFPTQAKPFILSIFHSLDAVNTSIGLWFGHINWGLVWRFLRSLCIGVIAGIGCMLIIIGVRSISVLHVATQEK